MSTNSDSGWVLYNYTPNKGASITVAVLFILFTIFYAFEVMRTFKQASADLEKIHSNVFGDKNDLYMDVTVKKSSMSNTACVLIPFIIGCIMEVVGYICRALSSANTQKLVPYIIQSVLLLVAPAFYAATIYMIFGRLLHVMECESLMMISARFGTTFFVLGDVVSFLLQASGGGLMAQEGSRKMGGNLVTAGLGVQIGFFAFFIINELRFTKRAREVCLFYPSISRKWWFLNMTLLSVSLLIMIRSVVRIIEFTEGSNGFIVSHEYFMYVFDALPMLLVVLLFCIGSFFGNVLNVIVECLNFNSLL